MQLSSTISHIERKTIIWGWSPRPRLCAHVSDFRLSPYQRTSQLVHPILYLNEAGLRQLGARIDRYEREKNPNLNIDDLSKSISITLLLASSIIILWILLVHHCSLILLFTELKEGRVAFHRPRWERSSGRRSADQRHYQAANEHLRRKGRRILGGNQGAAL